MFEPNKKYWVRSRINSQRISKHKDHSDWTVCSRSLLKNWYVLPNVHYTESYIFLIFWTYTIFSRNYSSVRETSNFFCSLLHDTAQGNWNNLFMRATDGLKLESSHLDVFLSRLQNHVKEKLIKRKNGLGWPPLPATSPSPTHPQVLQLLPIQFTPLWYFFFTWALETSI